MIIEGILIVSHQKYLKIPRQRVPLYKPFLNTYLYIIYNISYILYVDFSGVLFYFLQTSTTIWYQFLYVPFEKKSGKV